MAITTNKQERSNPREGLEKLQRLKQQAIPRRYTQPSEQAKRRYEKIWDEYLLLHQGYLPDKLKDTDGKRTRLAKEALDDGEGWAVRLCAWGELEQHTIQGEKQFNTLGLPTYVQSLKTLFDDDDRRQLKNILKKHYKHPCKVFLEVGRNEKVHIHILALAKDGPDHWVTRTPITDSNGGLFGKLKYLYKGPIDIWKHNDAGKRTKDIDSNRRWQGGYYLDQQKRAQREGKRLPPMEFDLNKIPSRPQHHEKAVMEDLKRRWETSNHK